MTNIEKHMPWLSKIPQGWHLHPLYYYFREHKRKNLSGEETNLLSLSYGRIIRKDINRVDGLLPASYNGYNIVAADDIVLRLTDLQNDQRSLRTGLVTERGIITSAYVSLRKTRDIDSRYFHYLLHAYDICKVFYAMGSGVRQGLNYSELSKLPLLEPPVEMQRSIADFLDARMMEIDAFRRNLEQQIASLEEFRHSVITENVIRGLDKSVLRRDSGAEWLGAIPQHWQTRRLDSLFVPRTQKVSDADFPPLSVTKNGIVPQLKHVAKTDSNDNRKLVRVGDFVINSRSDRRCSSGLSQFNGSVSVINTVLYSRNGSSVSGYFGWLLHSQVFADEFYRRGHGIVADLWTTGWSDMKTIIIPVPPEDEQLQIADALNVKCATIDSIISHKRDQLSSLNDYKNALIFEYVTGKKEVPGS